MVENILISASVSVPKGPKISVNRTLPVQAYGKIDVAVADGETVTVDVWPSNTKGRVLLLVIMSSWYGTAADSGVSYVVNPDPAVPDPEKFVLDQPHILIGNSAVTMLNATPKQMAFAYSKPAADPAAPGKVDIEILVGHKVQ